MKGLIMVKFQLLHHDWTPLDELDLIGAALVDRLSLLRHQTMPIPLHATRTKTGFIRHIKLV